MQSTNDMFITKNISNINPNESHLHSQNTEQSFALQNDSLHALTNLKHMATTQNFTKQMTNSTLHISHNQSPPLPIKIDTLTHPNNMQIEPLIIENLEVVLQDSKSNIPSTIKLPTSNYNAKDPNLSEKALPPDIATENKPLAGPGKYTTTSKSDSKPPTKDFYPTPTTTKPSTRIMGGYGSSGTYHLF